MYSGVLPSLRMKFSHGAFVGRGDLSSVGSHRPDGGGGILAFSDKGNGCAPADTKRSSSSSSLLAMVRLFDDVRGRRSLRMAEY